MTAPTIDIAASVRDAMANLGANPNAVADTLHHGGHFGRPGSATACPIASYLEHADLGIDRVHATPMHCIVYVGDDYTTVGVPAAVRRFMALFDVGRYAELAQAEGGEPR